MSVVSEADAARDRKAPWYVEMFLAFGGWVAGLLAALAIFAFVAVLFPNFEDDRAAAVVALFIGAVFVGGGTRLARRRRGDFLRHFAVAAIAAGFTASVIAFWYFLYSLPDGLFPGEGRLRFGNVGLATSVVFGAAAVAVTRAVRDVILTFLTTLSWFGVMAATVGALESERVLAPYIFEAYPALAMAAGLWLFTTPFGRSVAAAAGAALLIAPMPFYEASRDGFFLGVPAPLDGRPADVVSALAALYCLSILRARFALPPLLVAAVPVLVGVFLLPPAGDVAIVILLAGMAGAHRGLAAVGVVALAFHIGRYYHDLSVSLLTKSAILAGLGALTLATAFALRRFSGAGVRFDPEKPLPVPRRPAFAATLALGALLAGALLLVNRQVHSLETAFRDGRSIFLPLGPVDPRSLIQGDYMRLAFRETIFPSPDEAEAAPDAGEAFLHVDAEGVATFSRFAAPTDLPEGDEIRIDYRKVQGAIRYCPDSFFFQEGEANLFASARFAVVKVAPDGRARLVALADANRAVIDPKTARPQDRSEL